MTIAFTVNGKEIKEKSIVPNKELRGIKYPCPWFKDETITVFPYIDKGLWCNSEMDYNFMIPKIFELYNTISSSNERLMNNNLYKPDNYDFQNTIVRCLTLDGENNITSDGGLIKLFRSPDIGKLQHRWYATNLLRDRLTGKQLINHDGQGQLKYQWYLGKRYGLKMMYVTREYGNIMWKTWLRTDSFFRDNDWFYTDEKVDCNGFKSYPFIWYDKRHFEHKHAALSYFTEKLKRVP